MYQGTFCWSTVPRGSIFGPKSYEVIWKQEEKHMVWRLSYDLLSLENSSCFHMTDTFSLLVFIWLTHFLMTSYGFYSYWNRKILPVFYMTSQVIYFLNVNKVEIYIFLYLILQIFITMGCWTVPYNFKMFQILANKRERKHSWAAAGLNFYGSALY